MSQVQSNLMTLLSHVSGNGTNSCPDLATRGGRAFGKVLHHRVKVTFLFLLRLSPSLKYLALFQQQLQVSASEQSCPKEEPGSAHYFMLTETCLTLQSNTLSRPDVY